MKQYIFIILCLFLAACAARKTTVTLTDSVRTVSAVRTQSASAADSFFTALSEASASDSLHLQWAYALVTDSTGRTLFSARTLSGSRSTVRHSAKTVTQSASASDTSVTATADTTARHSARTETRTRSRQPPDVALFIFLIVAAAAAWVIIKYRKS